MQEYHLCLLKIDEKSLTTDLDKAGYKKMGVMVKTVDSFNEAINSLKAHNYDVILVNMDYRGADALGLLKKFKVHVDYKDIPIVMTSVSYKSNIEADVLEGGASLFVQQPFPRQFMIEKIKGLVSNKVRENQRVDSESSVKFKVNQKDYICPVADLSLSGLLFVTDKEFEKDIELELNIFLQGNKKPLHIVGVIVREVSAIELSENSNWTELSQDHRGYGVKFKEMSKTDKKNLEQHVHGKALSSYNMVYYL